ncbi:hypothetical protein [Algoriphagus yeomjeoni]|uniref:hypothetical protein n=1 Tax=Algoriphagus yeomjeoni TaxID=291403 RepID=UPI000DB9609E|nr:hypothetical protein [Algoriphagus yeomjeoni]
MNTPQTHPNPIEAVQEFGQLQAQKFAELLHHRTEKLSQRAKYLYLILFLLISLSGCAYLLVFKSSSFSPPKEPLPTTNLPYFPDLGNSNSDPDSLTSNPNTSKQYKP